MVLQRFLRFVRKPANAVLVSGLLAAGLLGAKATPHLFPGQVYRPLVEAYRAGRRVPALDPQRAEFREVCVDLGADPSRYDVFATSRWEVGSRGLAWLPAGVQFGVPVLMAEGGADSAPRRFAGALGASAGTDEGRAFREALALSRPARKFALAREVVRIRRGATAASVLLAPAVLLANFAALFAAQVLLPLPLLVNVAAVGAAALLLYRFLLGVLAEREDLIADDRAAGLGRDYAEGGLEFYEKALRRNVALRTILGGRGERMYTYYGNEASGLVYSPGASNTHKRDRLRQRLEKDKTA